MQTATSIQNVTFSADPVEPSVVELTVNFEVHFRGPSHVAGIVVTTDAWITSTVIQARFLGFGAHFEFWQADFDTQGPPTSFEFVVFCDDFGGDNSVPRIWNTNAGERFQVSA